MAEKIVIEVVTTDKGTTARVSGAVNKLGKEIDKTTGSLGRANKAQKEFTRNQAQGVIGIANSTKSFSKVAEGSSGLVAAYATLAANIFALTAAFNALRSAAQVEQVFSGLEAAGNRTGKTLTVIAKEMKAVTDNAISMEQGLRSTAQIAAAGFGQEQIIGLTKAAQDASVALGRNLTDSLDRITRGVIKLEPELLDELGVMTKLNESNAKYAAQLGKSATQLTNYERRVGYLNAVQEELNAKFGGLAAAAGDARVYDQLSASLNDLAKTVTSFINDAAAPFIKIFAGSQASLAGVALLFLGTIRGSLLGGLQQLADKQLKLAEATKESSKQFYAQQKAATAADAARQQQSLVKVRGAVDSLGIGPKVFRDISSELKSGALNAEEFDKKLKAANVSLDRSLRLHRQQQQTGIAGGRTLSPEALTDKENTIRYLEQQKQALQDLSKEEEKYRNVTTTASAQVKQLRAEAASARVKAYAQAQASDAIALAGNLQLAESFSTLKAATSNYAISLLAASRNGGILVKSINTIKTASFAAAGTIKIMGAALFTALPYIGALITAFGLLKQAYQALKSDKLKELEASMERLDEITGQVNNKVAELERLQKSQASAAIRVANSIKLQANAISELSDSYDEAFKKAAAYENSDGFFARLFKNGDSSSRAAEAAGVFQSFDTRGLVSYRTGIEENSKALDVFADNATKAYNIFSFQAFDDSRIEAQAKNLNALLKIAPKATEDVAKLYGGFDAIAKLPTDKKLEVIDKILKKVGEDAKGVAPQIESLEMALKETDLAVGEFLRSSTDTTPFDKVVTNINQLTSAMDDLRISFARGSLTAKDWEELLSGIGPELQKFLSVDTSKSLDLFRESDAIVQELSNKEGKLTAYETQKLSTAKKVVAQRAVVLTQVQQELANTEKLFEAAQNRVRLIKSELTLGKAILSANEENFKITGAGAAAKIDSENKLKDLEAESLKVQQTILRISIDQQKARLEELKTVDKVTQALSLQQKIAMASQRARLQEQLDKAEASGDEKLLSILQRQADKLDDKIDKYKEYESINREITGLEAASKSLENEILAIIVSKTNAQEKAAEIASRETDILVSRLNLYKEIRETAFQTIQDAKSLDALLSQRNDSLKEELRSIKERASLERTNLLTEQKSRLAKLEAEKGQAEAARSRATSPELLEANNTLLRYYNEQISDLNTEIKAKQESLTITEQLQLAEKVIFDTRKEGLEWQQQSLGYLMKELEAAKELSDEQQKRFELQTKLAYKKKGRELGEVGQQALDIEAAARAYELAVKQVELKKALIDLEYALLDAQRQMMKDELTVRRDTIQAMYGQTGDSRLLKRLEQLNSTIETLDISDIAISEAARSAKEAADINVENLKTELELARTRNSGIGDLFNLGKLDDIELRRKAEAAANRAEKAQRDEAYNIVKASAQMNSEALSIGVADPIISSNTKLIESIDRLSNVIEGKITQVQGTTGNLSIQDAAKYATNNGFRVSELAGYGGVTPGAHKGAGHREGRAFDLNIGYGNVEANDPVMSKRMDELAQHYRELGYTVLWKVAGHFDHMHVEISREMEKVSKSVTNIAAKGAANVVASAEQIVTEKTSSSEFNAAFASMDSAPAPTSMPENTKNEPIAPEPIVVTGAKDQKYSLQDTLDIADALTQKITENLKQLGPQGEAVAIARDGIFSFVGGSIEALRTLKDESASTADKFAAVASVVSSAISTISGIVTAGAEARTAAIDSEIAAEQKRDGKSAESVAKIEALEKKKDAIARKEFNTKKKLAIASAIVDTATGIVAALKYGPILGPILATVVGALGAAQIAIISGTSYQSTGSSSASSSPPAQLKIGKANTMVDLAKQNNNPGGEIGYLRGEQGYGSNSSNYKTIGSAYGGKYPRGYGNSAFVVGEKGPEVITPDVPMKVTPMDEYGKSNSTPINATFNINALDAKGVDQLLTDRRGHIISTLREAANASGEKFLEDVDVNIYTRPNTSKL